MRELIFGTILVAAAGAGVYFMPLRSEAPVAAYAMSVGEAKRMLGAADLRRGKEPFGRLDVLVTAPSPNVVRYEASGSFAALDCRAEMKAVNDAGINVSTSCKRQAMDGAAASAAAEMTDIAFAEYVDSVLARRPFNEGKVRAQSAGAAMRNLPKMQHDALKMQREISEMQAKSDNRRNSDWSSYEQVNDYASEPSDSGW
ncbi:MAG TPA: hypothetical protein VL094_10030 [Sphingomonadaceae bacterium]|nr:hypothetical protein [Sphingomonadaceae bacterium]